MKDFIDFCLGTIKLIKHSPMREASLEGFRLGGTVESVSHEDLESNDNDSVNGESLTPLNKKIFFATRLTLRHVGFQHIGMNCKSLLKLWEHVLST